MNSSSTVPGRWRDTLAGLARALRHWPWYATLRTLQLRFREDHLALTASSLTFTTLISLVPLVTVTLALSVLQALYAARSNEQRGLSTEALAGALRVDPLQVQPVLEDLLALGWCGRLDEEGAQRHVLLINIAHTPAQPLVDQLLLRDQRVTKSFRHKAGLATMTVADLLA